MLFGCVRSQCVLEYYKKWASGCTGTITANPSFRIKPLASTTAHIYWRMCRELGLNEETNKNSHVGKELDSRDFDHESRQPNPVRATSFHCIFVLTSAVVTIFTLSFCFRLRSTQIAFLPVVCALHRSAKFLLFLSICTT